MIMNIFEIENATINTNHPDFVGSADSLLNLFQDGEDLAGNGVVTSEAVDGASKTYSLLQRDRKPVEELDDFQDIESPAPLQKKKSVNATEQTLVAALKKSATH